MAVEQPEPPSGEESWNTFQQARTAQTASRQNPQAADLEILLRILHEYVKPLEQAVAALAEDTPRAEGMNVDWMILKAASEELAYRTDQLRDLHEAERMLPRLRSGLMLPAERYRDLTKYLRLNLGPSRSGGEVPIPHLIVGKVHARLKAAMARAAEGARQSVGAAPVAPPPRATPPAPPAEREWNPFAPEHLGFTPGKL